MANNIPHTWGYYAELSGDNIHLCSELHKQWSGGYSLRLHTGISAPSSDWTTHWPYQLNAKNYLRSYLAIGGGYYHAVHVHASICKTMQRPVVSSVYNVHFNLILGRFEWMIVKPRDFCSHHVFLPATLDYAVNIHAITYYQIIIWPK